MRPEDVSPRAGELYLLDVREPVEWQAGRIAGSHPIPLGELYLRLVEVPRDRTILAVCRHGNRSEAAMRGLRTLGYTSENLEGGVTAWHRAGLPLEADGGGPGKVV